MLPDNTMTLTLGCAKFRLLDQDWGNLPGTGLPRLLDMGQCNDSYGAVVVAQALADALGTDVNSLPLSLDISWFEQVRAALAVGDTISLFARWLCTGIQKENIGIQYKRIG